MRLGWHGVCFWILSEGRFLRQPRLMRSLQGSYRVALPCALLPPLRRPLAAASSPSLPFLATWLFAAAAAFGSTRETCSTCCWAWPLCWTTGGLSCAASVKQSPLNPGFQDRLFSLQHWESRALSMWAGGCELLDAGRASRGAALHRTPACSAGAASAGKPSARQQCHPHPECRRGNRILPSWELPRSCCV